MTYCIIIHSERFQFVSKEVTKRELAWNTLISKDRTPLQVILCPNVVAIQVNIHQHSWKIKFHIYYGILKFSLFPFWVLFPQIKYSHVSYS